MKKLFLASIVMSFILTGCGVPTSTVDAPVLRNLDNQNVGKNFVISGSGRPGAKVEILNDGVFVKYSDVGQDGVFNADISINKDGTSTLSAKQSLNGITSVESNTLTLVADITPPSKELSIISKLPDKTSNNKINIEGVAATNSIVVFNNEKLSVENDGKFKFIKILDEGENELIFSLEDSFGNSTGELKKQSIYCDSVAPVIKTGFDFGNDLNLGTTTEFVYLDIGEWRGWGDTASMPITGRVKGGFKKITVDGQLIQPDENNEIYKRLTLRWDYGLNKYKVIAEDKFGNKSSAYLEETAVSLDEQTNDYSDSYVDSSDDEDGSYDGCCKHCSAGKACGDSCINVNYTCHQPPGCACDY